MHSVYSCFIRRVNTIYLERLTVEEGTDLRNEPQNRDIERGTKFFFKHGQQYTISWNTTFLADFENFYNIRDNAVEFSGYSQRNDFVNFSH